MGHREEWIINGEKIILEDVIEVYKPTNITKNILIYNIRVFLAMRLLLDVLSVIKTVYLGCMRWNDGVLTAFLPEAVAYTHHR